MVVLYGTLATTYLTMAHPDAHVVNITFFEQWSETEVEDINFFIVGPHWYFRPHMGLLTVCAQHYEGLAWLLAFYFLLVFMPNLNQAWDSNQPRPAIKALHAPSRQSILGELLFCVFVMCVVYAGSILPCGRFYYDQVEGFFGNATLRIAYEYIYLYIGVIAHIIDKLERWFMSVPT